MGGGRVSPRAGDAGSATRRARARGLGSSLARARSPAGRDRGGAAGGPGPGRAGREVARAIEAPAS